MLRHIHSAALQRIQQSKLFRLSTYLQLPDAFSRVTVFAKQLGET
jgi:hypothetical protein